MKGIFAGMLFGLALLASAAMLPADDAPSKLPEDGWWVRYYGVMKDEPNSDESTLKRTYSLVGTTSENDQRCRWVEMNSVQTINGKERTDIIKFLVPERELLESERPLESLVRCWRKFDDREVRELKFSQPVGTPGFSASADFAFGREFVVFPGPRRKSEVVDERQVIEYQQGRLEIAEGRDCQHLATRRALTNGEKQTFIMKYTVWNHSRLGPAFAAMRAQVEYERDGKSVRTVTQEFVLDDFGIDAKSALPDNN